MAEPLTDRLLNAANDLAFPRDTQVHLGNVKNLLREAAASVSAAETAMREIAGVKHDGSSGDAKYMQGVACGWLALNEEEQ